MLCEPVSRSVAISMSSDAISSRVRLDRIQSFIPTHLWKLFNVR